MTDYSKQEMSSVTHSGQLVKNKRIIFCSGIILGLMFSIFVFMPMMNALSATSKSKDMRMQNMSKIQECEQSLTKINLTKDL